MEGNHRFRTPATRYVRRQIQRDQTVPVQPVQAVDQPPAAPVVTPQPPTKELSLHVSWRLPKLFRKRIIRPLKRGLYHLTIYYLNGSMLRRTTMLVVFAAMLLTIIFPALEGFIMHKTYALSPGEEAVLIRSSKPLADKLKLDTKTGAYLFNQDYAPANSASEIKAGGALIKASISEDPTKGVQVTDPINDQDFTVKPLFKLGTGKQQENRVVFPAFNGGGHLVYTAGGIGVKQEVTLDHYIGDKLKYEYELELGDQYAAKLEKNGAVGIYGSSLPISGNVSTGSATDAALLKKARQKAAKDKLMFELPAPTIKETGHKSTGVRARYVLHDGGKLTVEVDNLKQASYPLSIDPTVTAASGSGQFSFDANIETNVYIDPNNGYFQRSSLTGGNLLTWGSATSSTAAPHFMGSAVVYGGTLYVIGGTAGTTTTNISNGANSHLIEQSKINSNGTLAGFTDGNYAGLPAGGLSRFQVLTYNGYIYLIDGINGFTSTAAGGTVSNNVYYTRVTSESYSAFTNGAQLKNWNTTSTKPPTAVYDYGATVYNGTIYLAGGLNGSGTAQSAVLYASILPNGDLGTFNAATAALSAGRFGMDMQAYYGHLYIIGGNTGTLTAPTLQSSTLYASIASDGSIADAAWEVGSTLVSSDGASTQAMENLGSQFTMIYNGYLYVSGGCGTVNSTGSCTNVLSYTQLAQINADGSLGTFFPNDFQNGGTATLARAASPVLGYNGAMYSVGGCSAMNTGTVSCSTTTLTSNYATVNNVIGDISANRNPAALPVGLYGQATVVLNGYLYLLGGCLTASCDGSRAANYITYYALINADGSLGSWSNNTNSTDATSLGFDHQSTPLLGSADCAAGGTDYCGYTGLAAAVYNGFIYIVGGYDGNTSTTAGYNNAVYYMQPNAANGQTTAWTKSSATIANASAELGMIAYNSALYIVGGCVVASTSSKSIGCSTYYTQVQKSVIGSNGVPGSFTATNAGTQMQLSSGIAAFGLTFYGGYIYLAGGADATNAQESVVKRAKIDANGNLVSAITGAASGTWANTTASMTMPRRRTTAQVVNGYLYVIGGHNAADPTGPPGGSSGTTYGDIQIGKIDLSSGGTGDIVGDSNNLFTKSATSTLTPRWNAAVALGNGFMYVTGGCTAGPPPTGCTAVGTTDESFVVYNANNLGTNTWTGTGIADYSSQIANFMGGGTAVYNGYMYVATGCTNYNLASYGCNSSSFSGASAYAKINADGTISSWAAGPSLSTGLAFAKLEALNGYLYVVGGATSAGALPTTVYYSQINASTGAPGAWTAASNGLPAGRMAFGAAVFANRIYIVGGYTGSAAANVYYSPALPNGGNITAAWSTATASITTGRWENELVSAGAFLYNFGGYDGSTIYQDVQVAAPNTTTGDITSWSKGRDMPYKEASVAATAGNGYIYISGGRNGQATTSCSGDTYYASVNQNGTLGDWLKSPNLFGTARYAAGAVTSSGYLYLVGGHDCTAVISTAGQIIRQSGQLSEAIHATYTRYVDFGADATLRQLYVLGTNAQISGVDIDLWKIIVKTSTSLNNAWGQKFTTSLANLPSALPYGSPITFQALNASGINQGVSRYWDITFDIDQTQSFNFPDVTQPQITLYDFYFSPGPSKRLRLGKTFVNEQQTNLDAHP